MWATWPIFKAGLTVDSCNSQRRGRRRDLIELAGIYVLILMVIWTPRPYQRPLWGITAMIIIAVFAISFEGLDNMGLCTANLARSLWAVALAGTVAIAAVTLAGRMHTLHTPDSLASSIRHYGGYALWAMAQQIILQCFFLSRSLRIIPNATIAATFSACLFAIAHLPNPLLTLITLICGMASCLFYLHYRNLWPLAVAHAIIGISIAITIPGNLDHNMRVGISYLTYVQRGPLQAVSAQLPVNSAQ